MKRFAILSFAVAILSSAVSVPVRAEDAPVPQMPGPVKEHEWLKQLEGKWVNETEIFMKPDEKPMKGAGTEDVRLMGGFWIIGEGTGEMMGLTMKSVLTLGYDPEKKKYVGTWVDSMSSHLWTYQGTLDATGKILTLETEGPCPMKPGTISKFKEVIELKGKNEKLFTSSIQGEDGKWTTMVKVSSKRKE